MTRTYGRLMYRPGKNTARGLWGIQAEPHVMVKVKRVFGRVRQERSGVVVITDTPDVARDIEWFLERHPLDMDDVTAARLAEQATAHRAREQAVVDILAGNGRDYGLREPARPARPYQDVAANLAMATGRLLVVDELGLGKTTTGALVLRASGALPALVACPTHLPRQWERELNTVLPWLKTHIVRKGMPYDPTSLRDVDEEPDVLIMGYSKLYGWGDHLAGYVKAVIFDEMQELRHDRTGKYEAAARIADQATYRVGLTGTPVYNYGIEAFNIISVLEPDALGTRDEFVREWCSGYAEGPNRGKVPVANPAALGAYLRDQGIMLGRTRKDVGRELPEPVPDVVTVDADPGVIKKGVGDAADMARLILGRAAGSNWQKLQAGGQLDMMMRQATGVAKAPYVAAFVKLLLESEEKIVLCGWHREVYDLWLDALKEFHPVLYTGSENPKQKAASVERFMEGDSRVLILSLRSGSGLDGLQAASRVIVFGELDWSPQVHEQCIGRIRRDGQDDSDPVLVYYVVTESGSDPPIQEVLQIKRNQAEPMLSKDGKLFARPSADHDRIKMLAESVLASAGDATPAQEAGLDLVST